MELNIKIIDVAMTIARATAIMAKNALYEPPLSTNAKQLSRYSVLYSYLLIPYSAVMLLSCLIAV